MEIKELIETGKFELKVKTNSPKTQITGIENNIVSLDVHAPPEKGKANIEIIKFFTRLIKKKVTMISGMTSKKKVLKIS